MGFGCCNLDTFDSDVSWAYAKSNSLHLTADPSPLPERKLSCKIGNEVTVTAGDTCETQQTYEGPNTWRRGSLGLSK